MIKEFDTALVKYCLTVFPNIKQVDWGVEWEELIKNDRQIIYPACLVKASYEDYPLVKSIDIDSDVISKYFKILRKYTVRFLFGRESETVEGLRTLRYFYEKNPYNTFLLNGDEIKIGMRTHFMRTDEIRQPEDIRGAMKELSWHFQSVLVLEETESIPIIKKVILNINGEPLIELE